MGEQNRGGAYTEISKNAAVLGNRYLELRVGFGASAFHAIQLTNLLSEEPARRALRYRSAPVRCTIQREGKGTATVSRFPTVKADIRSPSAGGRAIVLTAVNEAMGLEAVVSYELAEEDFVLRKSVRIRNLHEPDVTVLRLETLDCRWARNAPIPALTRTGGGQAGFPLFIDGCFFVGQEFPDFVSAVHPAGFTLRQFPDKLLERGGCMESHRVVFGISPVGKVAGWFEKYIRRIAVRKEDLVKVFVDWPYVYFEARQNHELEEKILESLEDMRGTHGICFDHYVVDEAWYDTRGDLRDFTPPRWKNGIASVLDRIGKLGMRFGLGFHTVNWNIPGTGGIQDNPSVQECRNGNALCLGCRPFRRIVREAVMHHVKEHRLQHLHLDGIRWSCNRRNHGHRRGPYAREAAIGAVIDIIREARARNPELYVSGYVGFSRSPWWFQHVSTLFAGDPDMCSEHPTLWVEDSIHLLQDARIRFCRSRFHPWHLIHDCELWISDRWMANDPRVSRRWRDTVVLSLARGNLNPVLYGNPGLLNREDRGFLKRMFDLLDAKKELFCATRAILGDPAEGQTYGYSHIGKTEGYFVINNPRFEGRRVPLPLDAALGLDPDMTGFIAEIVYPRREILLNNGQLRFHHGDVVELPLRPFEIIMGRIRSANVGFAGEPADIGGAIGEPVFGGCAYEVDSSGGSGRLRCTLEALPGERRRIVFPAGEGEERYVVRPDGAVHGREGSGITVDFGGEKRPLSRRLVLRSESPGRYVCRLPSTLPYNPVLAIPVRFSRRNAPFYRLGLQRVVRVEAAVEGRPLSFSKTPDDDERYSSPLMSCWVTFRADLPEASCSKSLAVAVHGGMPSDVDVLIEEAWVLSVPEPRSTRKLEIEALPGRSFGTDRAGVQRPPGVSAGGDQAG